MLLMFPLNMTALAVLVVPRLRGAPGNMCSETGVREIS
jgi:hypothetical protein